MNRKNKCIIATNYLKLWYNIGNTVVLINKGAIPWIKIKVVKIKRRCIPAKLVVMSQQ